MNRRVFAPFAALGFALSAMALLPGCPSGTCLLKVCEGKNCRCSISSCQDGASFDVKRNRCVCNADRIKLAGQCMTTVQANMYCGKGRAWSKGGCITLSCKPGDEIDETTGWCVSKDQVNQVAANMGVAVGQGQQLGCPPGQKLVVNGQNAACVPLAQTCAPDEQWNGQACIKVQDCGTGATWDPNLGQCVQFAQSAGEDELKVNVAQWVQTTYGPNGGPGTPAFCNQFAKHPLSFGVPEGSSLALKITVQVSFPDNEVAKGVVQTATVYEANGAAPPAAGSAEVDQAAKSLAATLIGGGGRAASSTAATIVRCVVVNANKPIAVPASGGI
ncbi:MAG: hypothetical protein IPK82_18005 [Polyangiaceae bacterium]|nr:hypothetical protein [Polyangiaceae bacterium]